MPERERHFSAFVAVFFIFCLRRAGYFGRDQDHRMEMSADEILIGKNITISTPTSTVDPLRQFLKRFQTTSLLGIPRTK